MMIDNPIPAVHRNGTSAQELIDQQCAIHEAAEGLLRALRAATPNGRDYYTKPGPENWFELARQAHQRRMAEVEKIAREAMDIAVAVQEQAG